MAPDELLASLIRSGDATPVAIRVSTVATERRSVVVNGTDIASGEPLSIDYPVGHECEVPRPVEGEAVVVLVSPRRSDRGHHMVWIGSRAREVSIGRLLASEIEYPWGRADLARIMGIAEARP